MRQGIIQPVRRIITAKRASVFTGAFYLALKTPLEQGSCFIRVDAYCQRFSELPLMALNVASEPLFDIIPQIGTILLQTSVKPRPIVKSLPNKFAPCYKLPKFGYKIRLLNIDCLRLQSDILTLLLYVELFIFSKSVSREDHRSPYSIG
jgi:hypothetical protein